MDSELHLRRRTLALMYRRYIEAERDWTLTQREIRLWFPPHTQSFACSIGNLGSPVRRAYERRERAIHQLHVAKLKLEVAKSRFEARRKLMQSIALLPSPSDAFRNRSSHQGVPVVRIRGISVSD
ncbi:MAG: hypothetical protein ACU0DK_11715 [Pseudooceanicola sp.]